jgi:hypothetical protein
VGLLERGLMKRLTEAEKLDECFRIFTEAMKHRLEMKRKEGREGWDSAADALLKRRYFDLVDTANLCMFLLTARW